MMKSDRFPIAPWRLALALLIVLLSVAMSARAADNDRLPVTTKSPEARQLFERAMTEFENLRLEQANATLRQAIKVDPDFALAHLMLTFRNADPVETNRAVAKARSLAPHVSEGEKLMIRWLTGVHQANPLPGIAAMNDLLAQYPRDIHLAWMAGVWAQHQQQYDRSAVYFERALAIDPNFGPALNQVGYIYADEIEFDKAFDNMQRYVKLLPNEPNPEDSYAEMLRMAGRFDEAIIHYRVALGIDPSFISSLLGIADTLALQGKGEEARAEYAKVMQLAPPADRCAYGQQSAMTFVRENKLAEADAAFRALAARAHEAGQGFCEAESYRLSSMYQKDDRAALELLAKADSVVAEQHEFTPVERNLATALTLRQRAMRHAALNDWAFANAALQVLASLAESSHDQRIASLSEGAAGAVLLGQKKFAEAIPHLQADANDAFSQAHLALAYLKTGESENARTVGRRLTARYLPTIEDALVVAQFRTLAVTCKTGAKSDFCPAFVQQAAEGTVAK